MCWCQSIYLSNCPRPLLVGIDQRDRCVGILSDSQVACVSRSICFLVMALSKASLSQNRSKGPCVGIDTLAVNFPCSPCIVQSSYTTKQMQEFIFSGTSCQRYEIFTGKSILKNKFENLFSKPKIGFRFSNRKPDF